MTVRNVLAVIGAVNLTFWLLGAIGVGHSVTIYNKDPITCFVNGKKVGG